MFATINIFYMKFINPKVQFLAILAMGVYFIYALISFFQLRPWWIGIKSVIAYLLAYIGYVFLAFNFSYLIVYLKQ